MTTRGMQVVSSHTARKRPTRQPHPPPLTKPESVMLLMCILPAR